MTNPCSARFALFLVWLLLLVAFRTAAAAEAERIGEVQEVSGVASAQRPGAPDRFLAKGEALFEGDVISTSNTGYVQLTLKDGTKLTLRPNTTFAVDRLRHGAGEESATYRLVKGGVRALTGLISKRNPGGAEMRTSTATIGIRGTSFDARICANDCVREDKTGGGTAVTDDPIVARVASLSGTVTGTGRDGQTRTLTQGAALFTGESVTTAPKSHAVLAFRDESRVTVAADSIFRLEDVRFTGAKAESGSFFVRIAKGSARMLTGLLGKSDPKSVGVRIGTATIGIRGTGFDAGFSGGEPNQENIFVNAWQDTVTFTAGGQTITIGQGQTGMFQPGGNVLQLVDKPPQFLPPGTPQPQPNQTEHENLFGTGQQTTAPGLYLSVRDGDLVLSAEGGTIVNIGKGEVGFLAFGSTTPIRIQMPQFILNDNFPLPEVGVRSLIMPLTPRKDSLICEIK